MNLDFGLISACAVRNAQDYLFGEHVFYKIHADHTNLEVHGHIVLLIDLF